MFCGCDCGATAKEQQKRMDEEIEINRKIDSIGIDDYRKEIEVTKLLLLGAGESGKSTLFKQMKRLYGDGFRKKDFTLYASDIHRNCVGWLSVVCKQTKELYENHELETQVSPDLKEELEFLCNLDFESKIDDKIVEAWRKLEKDQGIITTLQHRSLYQIGDSADYFFSMLEKIAEPDFLPSEEDILRIRVRTTGIVESSFKILDNRFKIMDVGGQRSERRKWIHHFEDVTGVLFVAAISEYDQMLFEDEKTNRVRESLSLFKKICNSKFLKKTAMILFLNKKDLFQEKLKKVPLTVFDEEYKGGQDYESAVKYMQELFMKMNENPKRKIYCHATCATDKNNVDFVFRTVKDIIVRQNLDDGGLYD